MTHNSMQSGCPHCGHQRTYQLADGRFKCRACQKKFSVTGRRPRLSPAAAEAIVNGFVSGDSALAVAADAGLNPKTVQGYYSQIRKLLAAERERALASRYGGAEVSSELLTSAAPAERWQQAILVGCLVASSEEVELLLASETKGTELAGIDANEVAGWLVAADRRALDQLQLERIHCLGGNAAKPIARAFWRDAKHRLATYYGGFRKSFRFYLREMEFRNNIRNPPAAREHIRALLDWTTLSSTGDDDA